MVNPKLRALIMAVVDVDGCADPADIAALADAIAYDEYLTQKEYAAEDGGMCPYCHGDNVTFSGHLTFDASVVNHVCTCADCAEVWTEIYTLTGYTHKG
jgi:hypothetical protein